MGKGMWGLALVGAAFASAVEIHLDADAGRKPISPYLYGRNNCIYGSYGLPADVSADSLSLYRAAGITMVREAAGNNSTKYNWRNKLSSHPDWYNNVELEDWDAQAQLIQTSLPGVQGLFALQLLGWAADNRDYNFDSWAFNQATYWVGVDQNVAGGGTVNPSGGTKALVEGNPDLYLKPWPADSTVGILSHWFAVGGLGLDSNQFRYWNMDNEPEVWNDKHDDVVDTIMDPEQYMQKYFAVATKARTLFPGIKLVGPVFTNEWQWFHWQDDDQGNQTVIDYKGRYHTWIEYFIRRIGEHQDSTGVRLLDVLDFHYYPGLDANSESDAQTLSQMHRLWYDTTWSYPKANGLKSLNGGWDESLTQYYIFGRAQQWLDTWLGTGNGVTMGLSEIGAFNNTTPSLTANWYASMLGTFADHGVELLTPWDWYVGQWEVMHLFTHYAKSTRVESTSSMDTVVSAYTSVNQVGDSMTVVLVNHDRKSAQTATVSWSNFTVSASSAAVRQLANLPSGESFQSESVNALQASSVALNGQSFTMQLPALSVTAVLLDGSGTPVALQSMGNAVPADATVMLSGRTLQVVLPQQSGRVALLALSGRTLMDWGVQDAGSAVYHLDGLPAGLYLLKAGTQIQTLALR